MTTAQYKSSKTKGFTLIELLIVIAILSILAVIGFAVYSNLGAQAKSRNITRKADLDAISTALEVNRTATAYVALNANQFQNAAIIQLDPQGFVYCGNTDTTIPAGGLTAASTATACTPAGVGAYNPISATVPPAGTAWKICVWLEVEVNPAKAAQTFCKVSIQ